MTPFSLKNFNNKQKNKTKTKANNAGPYRKKKKRPNQKGGKWPGHERKPINTGPYCFNMKKYQV